MKVSSKSGPYTRFVPREEIDGVSAWHFSSMDDSEAVPAEPVVEAAAVDEQPAVQELLQKAYADGFAHGHEAGSQETRDALEAPLRQTMEDTAQRMAQLLHDTRDQLTRSEDMIARQLLELACDLARQVVRQELHHGADSLRTVISEAVAQLVDDGLPATVRLNPEDLSRLQQHLQDKAGSGLPELVADPAVSPGGCIVSSPSTTVDASIEKRWARAIGNLGLENPWNPENADV
ncbi:MAG TPA: FliH/SctL family protein [Hydrogenophaga sp.]|uniref:FliH/SctL family protein n=1 Tax=Hydrogenophaga sp. TaxID=1904254 RepID=UPI002BF73AB0|nr:FliH/SctL family protein [Hydrogenophaga sp.]HMN92468.1 FliH/SctL family protein [Hydrogenophaga sp.]HMP11065.1 FliH/SctL family protein [Hydrogenophaga sp.]